MKRQTSRKRYRKSYLCIIQQEDEFQKPSIQSQKENVIFLLNSGKWIPEMIAKSLKNELEEGTCKKNETQRRRKSEDSFFIAFFSKIC